MVTNGAEKDRAPLAVFILYVLPSISLFVC